MMTVVNKGVRLTRLAIVVAVAGLGLVSNGCDLGTYERRTAEPYQSKLVPDQPAEPAEEEGAE